MQQQPIISVIQSIDLLEAMMPPPWTISSIYQGKEESADAEDAAGVSFVSKLDSQVLEEISDEGQSDLSQVIPFQQLLPMDWHLVRTTRAGLEHHSL